MVFVVRQRPRLTAQIYGRPNGLSWLPRLDLPLACCIAGGHVSVPSTQGVSAERVPAPRARGGAACPLHPWLGWRLWSAVLAALVGCLGRGRSLALFDRSSLVRRSQRISGLGHQGQQGFKITGLGEDRHRERQHVRG